MGCRARRELSAPRARGRRGCSGPLVPGAGRVARNVRTMSSICALNSSGSMKASIAHGAEEVADAACRRCVGGHGAREGEGRREGTPVRAREHGESAPPRRGPGRSPCGRRGRGPSRSGRSAPPSIMARGSVVSWPARSMAQPVGDRLALAEADLDLAEAHGRGGHVETMGGSSRAGKAMAMGLVPSMRSAPQSGATTPGERWSWPSRSGRAPAPAAT